MVHERIAKLGALLGVPLLIVAAVVLFATRERVPADVAPPEPATAPAGREAGQLEPAREPDSAPAARRIEESGPAQEATGDPVLARELPFQGLVVDVATEEPVAHATLVAGGLEVRVDAHGRWQADEPLAAEVESIEFHDRVQGTHIRSLARSQLEPLGEGWLARIAIGPTYRLDIRDAPDLRPADCRARLVELRADGTEERGSWLELTAVDDALPFFRYDNPWEPDAPGSTFRVDVRNSHATRVGSSGLLHSAVGIYPDVVTVSIDRELASIQGRVVDRAEEPIRSALVTLAPVDAVELGDFVEEAERWPADRTESDGTFRFLGITPGTYRLHVRPRRGESPQGRTETLLTGLNRVDDFVFAVQEGAGMIEGKLVSRAGRGFAHQEIVRLRAVDGRDFELLDISSAGGRTRWGGLRGLSMNGEGRAQEGTHVFEFNEVPAGLYELSVVAQDGYVWTPRTARVEPPEDEIVFHREDDVPHHSIRLNVFDAETGERIERFTVQAQIGTTWNASAGEAAFGDSIGPFPIESNLRLTVHAAGFQPRWIGRRECAATDELEVELRPGFGWRLILRDLGHGFDSDDPDGRWAAATRPPVPGAKVFLGDRPAGTTGADGSVALTGARNREAPIRIEPPSGWRLVTTDAFRNGRLQDPARDVVLWLVRE